MSHLIELRQRISVVETIRKTTNAMRLISMSTHSRLRTKKAFLTEYRDRIESLLQAQGIRPGSITQSSTHEGKILIISLGSHKGLCGIFNTVLAHYTKDHLSKLSQPHDLMVVGTHLAQHLASIGITNYTVITNLSYATLTTKVKELLEHIKKNYRSIIIYSNFPKSFFSNEPITTIFDFSTTNNNSVLDKLTSLYTKTLLQELVFNSLLAEQAARFLAMDGATRNAEELISEMRLSYNKLRQSIITRELTDLAGGTL